MKLTLSDIIHQNIEKVMAIKDFKDFINLINSNIPLQLLIILINIKIFYEIEYGFNERKINYKVIINEIQSLINTMADKIHSIDQFERKLYEQIITDMVHKKDLTTNLMNKKISNINDF